MNAGILKDRPRFNRDIRLYLLAWALVAFAYVGVQGVLFNLYLLRLGYDTAFIGLLIGTGQLAWAAFALPAGAIGARIGLRNALVTAHLTVTLGMSLLLCGELLPAAMQAPWLFVWWTVLWLGASMNTVNSIPYLMAIATPEQRNAGFSAQQAVMALAGLAGAIVAGFLPQTLSALLGSDAAGPLTYRLALCVAPVAYVGAAACFLASRNVQLIRKMETGAEHGRAPVGLIAFFGLIVLLQSASEGSTRAFFNVYLDLGLNLATDHIGLLMGSAQLLPVVAAAATPLLLRKRGATNTYIVAALGIAASLLVLAIFSNWVAAGAAFGGVIMMAAVSAIARSLLSQEIVAPRWRTMTSAAITIGIASGWAATAMAGGYLIDGTGFRIVFLLSAGVALAAALLLMVLRRHTTTAITTYGLPKDGEIDEAGARRT